MSNINDFKSLNKRILRKQFLYTFIKETKNLRKSAVIWVKSKGAMPSVVLCMHYDILDCYQLYKRTRTKQSNLKK